ncbi:TonB-dependent receptor [Puia sp.]|jgi:outer membrane receptor protein involved in Fe transport|uniref:TonB-dependent receptor n=1 Tax=Puia sp. TaxID=2045100 RepID=UPI002F40AD67
MQRLTFLTLSLLAAFVVRAQDPFIITGKIYDSSAHAVLASASIKVKGASAGTVSAEDGSFRLKTAQKLPLTLVVSSIGYKPQEFQVTQNGTDGIAINLNTRTVLVDQVVVTASRVSESILRSPVTIEKLDVQSIKASPAPTFYDALTNVKGVQMTTLSLGYQVPNTRGFAGTTNSRFLQMVDGVDNISPGIGAPVANAVGPSELDIESVELIPGAASAIYGLNAINGIANLKTKSPFQYEGLSVYLKQGVNHINDPDHGAALYSEYAIRWAKTLSPKFAFKVNAAHSQGIDWIANNRHDQYFDVGNKTNASVAGVNPGADLINRYGDEYNSDMKTLTLAGKKYDVSRTGYLEKDLTDYAVSNSKVDASLHYKPNGSTQLSYTYRTGWVTNNYQRGNRVRLDGEHIQQHAFDLKARDFSVKAYYTLENTGNNSFNFRPLGENIDMAFKKSPQWWNDYTTGFNNAYNNTGASTFHDVNTSLTTARDFADAGRYQPGTKAFDSVRNRIIHTNNWDTVGAQMLLKSAFVHAEGQYDWSRLIPFVQILTGANYRNYIVTPDGNNYVNPGAWNDAKLAHDKFHYYTWGAFVQATKQLVDEKLKLTASVRVDKTQYFDPKWNPRVALVYSPAVQHNFRLSFQNGYRFPTLFEGFAYVNNGGVRRLGGLPLISNHLQAFENSYINSSVTAFKNAVNADQNTGGLNQNAAIEKEAGLLTPSTYNYIQPEHINSFEAGYKGMWLDNTLFVDVDYYFSAYDHFIGQLDITQPRTGTIGSTVNLNTATQIYNGTVTKYKMWTNSKSRVTNQGVEVGVKYNFFKKFILTGNASYAAIVSSESTDAFTPAFNTPSWITNVSIGNREILPNTGFTVGWHWQSKFYWNSPLAAGEVPGYGTVDAQVNYRLPKLFSTLKLGTTDLFNTRYFQYLGGPTIGAFYYFTIVFDTNPRR